MKIITDSYVIPAKEALASNGNVKIVSTNTKADIWVPKKFIASKQRYVVYKLNEPGDFFTAYSTSDTLNEDGIPIFSKGDVVEREKESIDFIGWAEDMPTPFEPTLDEKCAAMAKYGISPKW